MNLRQLFLDHVAQTSDFPLSIVVERAEGMYLYTNEGKEILDFDSGFSVSALGHRHPAVIKAIKAQVDRYLHTTVYGEHIQSPQVHYASRLVEYLGQPFESVYFLSSGSEAVELAIKIGRKHTQRYEVISAKKAYHGSTLGAESLRSDLDYTSAFAPTIPQVHHIAFNSIADLKHITTKTACVILEVIQAEAGVILPEAGYLSALRRRCDETGTLLVFDEIQTGFGRTGKMFAYENYDVKPDVLLLAKGMGGGMPLSALVSSKAIVSSICRQPMLGHITTFGGHPVSCAAGLALFDHLLQSDTISQVLDKTQTLVNALVHPKIVAVRHFGLFVAVELESSQQVVSLVNKALERGLMVNFFLFNDRCFRLAPPLIVSNEDIAKAVSILNLCLDEV